MNKIRKALIATAGTFGALLGSALLDGNLTVPETLAAVGGGLVVGFAAWRVPNAG
jgi:hypothetical protein